MNGGVCAGCVSKYPGYHVNCSDFRFSWSNIFKDDHYSFNASDFSFVGLLGTLFMQYFPEDGLVGKVYFFDHL
jgi:hypothetical protein